MVQKFPENTSMNLLCSPAIFIFFFFSSLVSCQTPSPSTTPPFFSPLPSPNPSSSNLPLSSRYLPNVQLLGSGFDSKIGQPVLKSTKYSVVFISYAFQNVLSVSGVNYLIPDQSIGKVISSIDPEPEVQVFTSKSEVEQTLFKDLTSGFSDQFISGMFSDSHQSITFSRTNNKSQGYTAFTNQRVKSWEISLVGFLNITQDFLTSVSNLPSSFNSGTCSSFKSFINRYGTHYLNQIVFGGSISMTSIFSKIVYEKRGSSINEDLQTLFSLLTYSGTLSSQQQKQLNELESVYLSEIILEGGNSLDYQANQWKQWSNTVSNNPIPISMDLQPITKIIPSQYSNKISAIQTAIEAYLGQNQNSQSPPGSGEWTTTIPMPVKISEFGYGQINGSIYVAGGSNGKVLSRFYSFNPLTNQWTSLPNLPEKIYQMGSAVVGNQFYVVGGNILGEEDSNEVWSYDTSSSSKEWINLPNLPTGRRYLSCAVVDEVIYALGGFFNGTNLNSNEAFDTRSNSWSIKSPLPTPRSDLTAAVVDGIIYALGGWNEFSSSSLSSNEAYDPKTNFWTTKSSLPVGVWGASSAVIDGLIFVFGGLSDPRKYEKIVQIYNPKTDSWIQGNPMPVERGNGGAVSIGNSAYVFGGFDYGIGNLSEMDVYQQPGNEWC